MGRFVTNRPIGLRQMHAPNLRRVDGASLSTMGYLRVWRGEQSRHILINLTLPFWGSMMTSI